MAIVALAQQCLPTGTREVLHSIFKRELRWYQRSTEHLVTGVVVGAIPRLPTLVFGRTAHHNKSELTRYTWASTARIWKVVSVDDASVTYRYASDGPHGNKYGY